MRTFLDWFVSRISGGLVTGILVGGAHLVLSRRHLRKVTESQTSAIREITDAQTQVLKGSAGEKQPAP